MCEPISVSNELIRTKGMAVSSDLSSTRLDELEILARNLSRRTARCLVHQDNLRAQCTHHLGPLGGVPARHHRDKWIAFDCTNDGKSGTHVAAGQLDDSLPGAKGSRPLGFLDDPKGNPIFLGKARIQIVELQQ